MEKERTLQLTVAETTVQRDIGRAIARLSTSYMALLGLSSGDTILIKGKSDAVATAFQAAPEDEGLDIIRIDGTLRFNAGTSLGEKVTVMKTEAKAATEIVLAPLEMIQDAQVRVRTNSGEKQFPLFQILTIEIKKKLMDRPFLKGNKIIIDLMGTSFQFGVKKASPKGTVILSPQTKLSITPEVFKDDLGKIPEVSYEDIGGLSEEIDQIREMVELPMKHPEVFERLGIGAPKGVLLSGPPGTGKTLLAKAVASETESEFYSIAGPEIMSKFYGESEKQLRDMFKEAEENAPSILFIDEIDAIAPKREEVTGEMERRIVATLLATLDGLKSRGQVVVIAATNRPDSLDPALRRPGRFDREIMINAPDTKGRKEILQIHSRGMPLHEDVDLDKLADITLAYTGADLEALCKEAAMKSLKNYLPSLKDFDEKVPDNVLQKIVVKMEHFMSGFRKVQPSAMREVLIRKPKITWADIGGLKATKQKLKEVIEWPLEHPKLFVKAGVKPAKGILLHGPPGTGKTLLAKAIANEAQANFISVKGPELISKWVGESEKHVRDIFKKARQVAPSVIFFDEFDSISSVRGQSQNDATERTVNQLLTELDGVEDLEKVVVIAATNRPDLVDPGLLRPGRIDIKIEIPLPDEESREAIFEVHTKGMPIESSVDLTDLAKKTEKMSGADIEAICREAGMESIRTARKNNTDDISVTGIDFKKALEEVSASSKREPTRVKNHLRDYIQ